MATEFREFSSDETSSVIPHFEGSLPVAKGKKKDMAETARAPLNTMQLPLNNTPIVTDPNVESVTNAVTKANQQIQQELPKPQAPSSVKELGKEVQQVGRSIGDTLMENWMIPAGILATYGAYKLLSEKPPTAVHPSEQPQPPSNKSIRDRMLLGEVKEPTFEAPVTAPTTTEKPPVSAYSSAEQEMLQRSAANAAAKAQEAEVKRLQGQSAVPGGVAPAAAPAPVAPAQITPEAPKSGFAWDHPQTMQPTVTQAVEAGVSPTQALQVEVAKQLDATPAQTTQPAEPPKNKGGRPSKATKEAQLAGGVFKEGFGGADNWMQSQVGHDIRRFIKDEFNAGKPYGGGQAAMEKAYADIGRYEQWLKENIPVQTLNRAERKALGVPSPEPYGPLGKAMKVGGVAGLLMTATQAANAKQAAQNVGEALLPIGMTPSELATGTLTEKQLRAFQEAQKLGSPYRSVPPPR